MTAGITTIASATDTATWVHVCYYTWASTIGLGT